MRLFTALRFFAYGVLALATLEMAPRIEDYLRHGAPIFGVYSINTVFRPSPYGKEGKPFAHYLKWSMNSLGYRGPEPVAGRINIVTFGASETFGLYESPEHEYPRQLEALFDARRPGGYNVVNIAIPGQRIGRTAYLEHAVKQLGARYVVIYPSPANYIGSTEPFCGQPDQPAPVQFGLTERSRLFGRIEQLVKQQVPPAVMTRVRRFSIWRETRHTPVADRVPQASIDAFGTDLECAVNAARALGAQPIVVTHATLFGAAVQPADEDMLVAWRRFYPELAEGGFLDLEQRANAAALAVAAHTGARVVRADALIPRGRENFADFVHFTDRGAGLMAAALADAILADAPGTDQPAAEPRKPE